MIESITANYTHKNFFGDSVSDSCSTSAKYLSTQDLSALLEKQHRAAIKLTCLLDAPVLFFNLGDNNSVRVYYERIDDKLMCNITHFYSSVGSFDLEMRVIPLRAKNLIRALFEADNAEFEDAREMFGWVWSRL